jgi:hypothetical protein
MIKPLLLVFGVLICWSAPLYSQVDTPTPITQDTLPSKGQVVEQLPGDTLPNIDLDQPLPSDDKIGSSSNRQVVKLAESDLDDKIIKGAVDSMLFDKTGNIVWLYGDAFVKYQDKELRADLIILDMESKIAEARTTDNKNYTQKPTFTDNGKTYKYKGLRYNFETEKGIVTDAITSEGEFIVHGETTKYVSAGGDIFSDSDVIYNANSLITTCNHDHPHFGFKAKKLKVIPDKVVVSGPANLQIAGVPTPLWIPFGLFPLTDGTTTGLIFPDGYQFYSEDLGFGLSGVGWYFPINDYVHTSVTADFYSLGTWGLSSRTNYAKKYKYTGSFNLSYNDFKQEASDGLSVNSRKGFNIQINHRQDTKAHPFINFGGDISIVGNNNVNRVNNDAQSVLTNTYRSNFYYTHQMPSTPFTFRMGLNHNQNTNTRIMNITLPDISLRMRTIFPFERKNSGGNEPKWYEKISLSYDAQTLLRTTTTDTTLFTQETLDNVRAGVNQTASVSVTTKILKYLNVTPSINLDETWLANSVNKSIGRNQVLNFIEADTLAGIEADSFVTFVDTVLTDVFTDFSTYREFDAGVSLQTTIFGTKNFRLGKLRGIRHLLKPNIRFSYSPDQSNLVDTLTYFDTRERVLTYTKFDEGPFGSPRFSELQSQLSYGLDNTLELKYFSKKDSTEKKFKIFDSVTMRGSRNFAADSLKWGTHTMSSRTRLFNGITELRSDWTFDPYVEVNSRRVATTVWSQSKRPVRLETGRISLSNNISFRKLRDSFNKKRSEKSDRNSNEQEDLRPEPLGTSLNDIDGRQPGLLPSDRNTLDAEDDRDKQKEEKEGKKLRSIWSILDGMNLRHELRYAIRGNDGKLESGITDHTLTFGGRFDLTDNWGVNIGNLGYDFQGRGLSYAAISFTRKLHCWNMAISWFPDRGNTYQFAISVNSSTLSFLKYNYGQNNTDGFFGL